MMASLFKPTYTKTDRKTGEKIRRKSRKWYGQFRDSAGEIHRVPLCTDKEAARALLRDAAQRVERRINLKWQRLVGPIHEMRVGADAGVGMFGGVVIGPSGLGIAVVSHGGDERSSRWK